MKTLAILVLSLFQTQAWAGDSKFQGCMKQIDGVCLKKEKGKDPQIFVCLKEHEDKFSKLPCFQAYLAKGFAVESALALVKKQQKELAKVQAGYMAMCVKNLKDICGSKDAVACVNKKKGHFKASLCAQQFVENDKKVKAYNAKLAKDLATKAVRIAKAKAALKKAEALAKAKKAAIAAIMKANAGNPALQERQAKAARDAADKAFAMVMAKKAALQAIEQAKGSRREAAIKQAKEVAQMACIANLEAACKDVKSDDDLGKCFEKHSVLVSQSPCLQGYLMKRMMSRMKQVAECSAKLAEMCKGKMDMNQCREKYGDKLDGECRRALTKGVQEQKDRNVKVDQMGKSYDGCMKVMDKYCPNKDQECLLKNKDIIQKNCKS